MIQEALSGLRQAALSGDDDLAETLAAGLDERAAPGLQAMLLDANPDVRWWAVRALAVIGADPRLFAPLLQDPDSNVRACAALALAQAPPTGVVEEMVETLITHLADPDSRVADLSALALARMGPAASPALVRALEGSNLAAHSRAARALRSAATPEAIPALLGALEGDSVSADYYAQDALERLGVGLVLFKP